jgi:hypothetical protein
VIAQTQKASIVVSHIRLVLDTTKIGAAMTHAPASIGIDAEQPREPAGAGDDGDSRQKEAGVQADFTPPGDRTDERHVVRRERRILRDRRHPGERAFPVDVKAVEVERR